MNARDLRPDATGQPMHPAGADWRLLAQARQGSEASARQLVHQLSPTAHGLAMQLLRHPQDAEDAVQDAFARLWTSQASQDSQDSHDGSPHSATLATYFNTIVINRCKTRLTQRRELATDPELLTPMADERQQTQGRDATAWQPLGSDTSPDHPTKQAVEQALSRLPARQRMALAMWAYADAEVPDIARSLDLGANAAHQLLHRARASLKHLLTGAHP